MYLRHPDHDTDGLFACHCGHYFTTGWNPGADFDCPRCGSEFNSGGQRLAPRSQWGEETGEHPADIAAAFRFQSGQDLTETADTILALAHQIRSLGNAQAADALDQAAKLLNPPTPAPATEFWPRVAQLQAAGLSIDDAELAARSERL